MNKDSDINKNNHWYSVIDKPLYIKNKHGDWVCTLDGDNENGFIAAVETNEGWWIRHCVIEDKIGLCVVGSEYSAIICLSCLLCLFL